MFHSLLNTPRNFPLPYHGFWLKGWPISKIYKGHEPETTKFYERVLKKTDRVADVGAANGYYTALFMKHAGIVCSFEANPYQIPNLMFAGAKNVRNVAIGAERGVATLSFPPKKYGLSSIAYAPGTETRTVPVVPLKEYGHFDWVKIDVEGAELDVLKGMNHTNCTVELSPKVLAKCSSTPDALLDGIEALGYNWKVIDNNGWPTKCDRQTAIELATRKGHINLVCVPSR